jgi:hypothetical protein
MLVVHFDAMAGDLLTPTLVDDLHYDRLSMGHLLTIQLRKPLSPPPLCPSRHPPSPSIENEREPQPSVHYYTPDLEGWYARLVAHHMHVLRRPPLLPPPASRPTAGKARQPPPPRLLFEDPGGHVIELRRCDCCLPSSSASSLSSSLSSSQAFPSSYTHLFAGVSPAPSEWMGPSVVGQAGGHS